MTQDYNFIRGLWLPSHPYVFFNKLNPIETWHMATEIGSIEAAWKLVKEDTEDQIWIGLDFTTNKYLRSFS